MFCPTSEEKEDVCHIGSSTLYACAACRIKPNLWMFPVLLSGIFAKGVTIGDEWTLSLHPAWGAINGFSDKHKTISGSLTLEFLWNTTTAEDKGFVDMRDNVDIPNYLSGPSSMTHPNVKEQKKSRISQAVIKYTGDFKQAVDTTCFPFDRLEMSFRIQLVAPATRKFKIGLFCSQLGSETKAPEEGVRAFGADGEELEKTTPPTKSRRAAAGRPELLAKGQHTDRLQNPAKLRRFWIRGGIRAG